VARHGSRVGRRRWPTGSASGFGRARVNKTRRRGGQSPSRLAHSRPHLPNSLRAPTRLSAARRVGCGDPTSVTRHGEPRRPALPRTLDLLQLRIWHLVFLMEESRGMGGMNEARLFGLVRRIRVSILRCSPTSSRRSARFDPGSPPRDAESPYFVGDPLDGTWREYCNAYVESRSCLASNSFFPAEEDRKIRP